MKIIEPRVFWFSHRVSYGETDKMGIVYYGEYLHLFERARTEYLRTVLGISYSSLEKDGFFLPVCHAECTYKHSIQYDEQLYIKTWIDTWKKVSLSFSYEIYTEEKNMCYAFGTTKLACVTASSIPVKLPTELYEAYVASHM